MLIDDRLHYILDENKNPVEAELIKWAKWFEDVENRRIKLTYLFNKDLMISSIFTGIPHDGGMFETLERFEKQDFEEITRYETYEDCLKDHDKMIEKWLKSRKKGIGGMSISGAKA